MNVRDIAVDFVDVEFIVLQLQLTKTPQQNIRIFC